MWRSWIVPMVLIASGCEVVFPIEAPGDVDGGIDAPPNAPRVFSSPGPAASLYGGYPKALTVTLATDQPTSTIYYTTDGSVPTMASTSAPGPASVMVPSTKTLRYFAVGNDGASSAVAGEVFSIATSAQSLAGYLVTATTLDATSPVVVATPGQALAARTTVQVWVQSSCAACGAQVVYGVDDVDQGCLYDASPGVYPGITATKTFNVAAPTTPGVHEVRVAHIEASSCLAAMNSMALANRPTVARIGVIIVP